MAEQFLKRTFRCAASVEPGGMKIEVEVVRGDSSYTRTFTLEKPAQWEDLQEAIRTTVNEFIGPEWVTYT